jgi:hypothetical protein
VKTRLIAHSGIIATTIAMIAPSLVAQSTALHASTLRTPVQHDEETATWHAGDVIVWIRVGSSGTIRIFGSHGYRSAFAQGVAITPDDADRFAAIAESPLTAPATTYLGDSALAIESTRAGDSTTLTIRLGASRPDATAFMMSAADARTIAPSLRATARAARDNTPAASAIPATAPSAPDADSAKTPSTPLPATAPSTTTPTPPREESQTALSGAAATTAPESVSVTATPSEPIRVAAKPVLTQSPVVKQNAGADLRVMTAKLTVIRRADTSMRKTSTGSIAKTQTSDATALDAERLAASTVANLVRQWQPQLSLCYSENGLRLNPALSGSISAVLGIRPQGNVATVTFVSHKWSGAGGVEAETCMLAKMRAWLFPPAAMPSRHTLSMAFAP